MLHGEVAQFVTGKFLEAVAVLQTAKQEQERILRIPAQKVQKAQEFVAREVAEQLVRVLKTEGGRRLSRRVRLVRSLAHDVPRGQFTPETALDLLAELVETMQSLNLLRR